MTEDCILSAALQSLSTTWTVQTTSPSFNQPLLPLVCIPEYFE